MWNVGGYGINEKKLGCKELWKVIEGDIVIMIWNSRRINIEGKDVEM